MKDEQQHSKPKVTYSPEIRTLAYAMETMSHEERCAAILELADKQHAIGLKNGHFGYIPKREVAAQLEAAKAEARLDQARRSHAKTRLMTPEQAGRWLAAQVNNLKLKHQEG